MGAMDQKVVVITGAASGIGRAMAQDAARRGANVVLWDVRQEDLDQSAKLAQDAGAEVETALVDVSDRQAVYQAADEATARWGKVDAIINNAGVSLTVDVAQMSYEDFEWVMDINFWGVVYGTKAFLPQMLERNSGYIVNISSIFGLMGIPTQSAYNAAKFAVRGFTESLRQELHEHDINVMSVHPGGIKTNIVRYGRFYKDPTGNTDHEKMSNNFEKRLARTTAEDAARIILDGMLAGRRRQLVGLDAQIYDLFPRIAPERYDDILAALSKYLG